MKTNSLIIIVSIIAFVSIWPIWFFANNTIIFEDGKLCISNQEGNDIMVMCFNDNFENKEFDCPENFVIYENNCIAVNSENREVHDASMFFNSVDGKLTEFCVGPGFTSGEGGLPINEKCQDIISYSISDNEIQNLVLNDLIINEN